LLKINGNFEINDRAVDGMDMAAQSSPVPVFTIPIQLPCERKINEDA
jgi:hypothetical protein